MTSPQSLVSQPSLWRELWSAVQLLTKRERRHAIAYALTSVIAGLLDTLVLASTMPFIALLVDLDNALANRHLAAIQSLLGMPSSSNFVLIVGLICVTLVIGSGLFSSWLQRRTNRFVANCQARLAHEIMDSLAHAPYVWFLGINTLIVNHVFQRDVALWARELINRLLNIARDLTLVLMPLGLVVIVTPIVGVLTLGAIAGLVVAVIVFTRPRITALIREKQEADARAYSLAGQMLTGIKDVAISGRRSEFVGAFIRAYQVYTRTSAEIQNHHQLPNKAILMFGQVGLLVVASVLWALGSDRGTLAAQLSLLILVTSRIVPAANRLSSAISTFIGVLPAVRDIDGLLNQIKGAGVQGRMMMISKSISRPWKRIVFESVSFVYPNNSMPAMSDLSLTIEAGKTYGIVGASGAGKSTVADLLMGLVTPTVGHISVDAAPLDQASIANWQSKIGYVPQAPFVLDDTVAANVAFGIPGEKRDTIRLTHAIGVANLAELVSDLPNGLNTPLGDRGLRLSGGQRQRIAIARALYDECDLLVLDEATAALDTVSERAVQDAVSRLKGQITTVAIAHRLSTIRDCDRIFVFDQGRLVAEGSWSELLANSAHFRKIVEIGNDKDIAA